MTVPRAGSPGERDEAGPPSFSVDRSVRERAVVLALQGDLDMASAGQLVQAAADITPGSELIIDLRKLEFMDSSGLRTLMNLDLRAREEGWSVALAGPQPAVMRLLTLTGFQDRVTILDDASLPEPG